MSKKSSNPEPSDFAHLVKNGKVTILGFGSLVSEKSARGSFDFDHFRFATVEGYARIFNQASWINISWGDAKVPSGEVCALSFAKIAGISSRVALMDVPFPSGVSGFLHREASYEIWEIPFVSDLGEKGIALACGECPDSVGRRIWGADNWYFQRCEGRIYYCDPVPSDLIPLVPEIQINDHTFEKGNPENWLPFTIDGSAAKYKLPNRQWVYPSPGYLRLVYRAYSRAGSELRENFLQKTFLMDRMTNLAKYLDANPLLKDFVLDPQHHPEWSCDRYG